MAGADIEYRVLVTYASGGSLLGDLEKANGHGVHLGAALREGANAAGELGSQLVEGFQHAVEHAAHLAEHMAKIVGAAGIAAAVYGVSHLNNELEQTNIALASIFKAQGFAPTFSAAFDMAGNQVGKMKQDIKSLPGDLGQLSNVMLQLASPLATAGKSPDEIRRMAGKTMLASQILLGSKYGAAAQQIGAREMTMLLQGNMSSRNAFAQELPGMQQYRGQWKAMSEEKRLEIVQQKIDALVTDAHDKFSTSFVAMWTTFKDNMKYAFLAPATMPLFEAVKRTLGDINTWFDKNQARVSVFTTILGQELASAWDKGTKVVQEWGPTIVDFARQLGNELRKIWDQLAPALSSIGDALKGVLGDGTIIKDIKKVLELYAATKIVGTGSSSGKGLGAAIGGALGMLAGPGGGMAGAAVGSAAGSVLGPAGLAAAFIPIIGPMVATVGTLGEKATEAGLALALLDPDRSKEATEETAKLARAFDHLTDDLMVKVGPPLEDFALAVLPKLTGALETLTATIDGATASWDAFWGNAQASQTRRETYSEAAHQSEIDLLRRREDARRLAEHEGTGTRETARGGGPGGGGMLIQKVEIVISTTQDANRVAEAVFDKIDNIKRHPKVSTHVPNYSK